MSEDNDGSSILLLDDDPMVTETLGALLEEETDWQVESFNRASDALARLADHRFDTVLSDYLMPEMDGVKFLEQVRDASPSTTRVLLTGYADKANAIHSINRVQLYYYIEKPWDNDELIVVLRNAVERSRMMSELDCLMNRLAQRDEEFEQIRSRLLKAIL